MSSRASLALVSVFVVACLLVFGVWRVIEPADLRSVVESTGPVAPAAYVALSAVLACVMVPGALLAAAAGVIFGPVAGTAVALCSAIAAAVLGLVLGRRLGRSGVVDLGGQRLARLERLLGRHGAWAVVAQRLFPGVPDGPANYAFGALGVAVVQIVLGTLVGSAPRAFSYAAIGSSAVSLDPRWAAAGTAVLIAAGTAGSLIAARAGWRGRRRSGAEASRVPDSEE